MKARGVKSDALADSFRAELVVLIPRLRRFGLTLTRGNHDSADELVQATCARALEKRHQWQPGTKLDSWLFKILNSIWLNDIKSRKVRAGHGSVDVDLLVARARDADIEIEVTRTLQHLMDLPERWRKCLLLVYVEGYTYEECAQILDIPIGTVMSGLSRSRLRLAEARQKSGRDSASKADSST